MSCKLDLNNKPSIKCNKCKKHFDLSCANISSRKMQNMTKEQKIKWLCRDCDGRLHKNTKLADNINTTKKDYTSPITSTTQHAPINNLSTNSPITYKDLTLDKITMRRPRLKTKTETVKHHQLHPHSDEEEQSFISEDSSFRRSLPDLSTRINEDVSELKEKIEELTLQLKSAHLEIDNLSLENKRLLDKISQQDLKLNTLSAMNSPCTPLQPKKRKKKIVVTPLCTESTDETCPTSQEPPNSAKPTEPNQGVQKNLQSVSTLEPTVNTLEQDSSPNKIWIYGSQQCSGLALALLKTRENSKYEKYSVESFIKPFARSDEVLKMCHKDVSYMNETSKVVICVGENDSNPMKLITELGAILKKISKCPVFILSVLHNYCLNEYLLNTKLKLLCNVYKNCSFIQCSMTNNKHMYLNNICNKINFNIDYIDYACCYLDTKSIKRRLQSTRLQLSTRCNTYPTKTQLKQKTILDYFSIKQVSTSSHEKELSNQFFRD